MSELRALFDQYFEFIPALDDALRDEVFRIRYGVYCVEGLIPGFDAKQFPDGLERDCHDAQSVHALLRHCPSGTWAGTVRLVRPDPVIASGLLPIEQHGIGRFDRALAGTLPSRDRVAEISRLVLTRQFRARPGESRTPYGARPDPTIPGSDSRRRFPHTALGLFVAITRLSVMHGIDFWYAAMEARLNRLLQGFSLKLDQIGPEIEYHGSRLPFFSEADAVLRRARTLQPEIWDLLTEGGRFQPTPKDATTRPPDS